MLFFQVIEQLEMKDISLFVGVVIVALDFMTFLWFIALTFLVPFWALKSPVPDFL